MTTVMLANSYTGPSALQATDVDLGEPDAGSVLIEVRAAGINPADAKTLYGAFGRDESKLPIGAGSEVAGVVVAVSDGVEGPAGPIHVGDEVVGYRVSRGFAERVIAPAGSVLPKPASLGWNEAASLLLAGTTAWHLLEATKVADGDRVIVHGASGAVGLLASQLAISRGATVVGTSSPGNFDLLREYGVEPIAYGDGLLDRLREALPEGADVALDTVGSDEALDSSVELVGPRDRIATVAGFAHGADLGVQRLGGGPGADPGSSIRAAARLPLLELAGNGQLRIRIATTYPLAQAVEALQLVEGQHPGGKVVLIP